LLPTPLVHPDLAALAALAVRADLLDTVNRAVEPTHASV
jgi:hypothetical protein